MFLKKCRCGKSSKNFKVDIGDFFINEECCKLAGFDDFGNVAADPKFAVEEYEKKLLKELNSRLFKYEKAMEKARSAQAKERALVNLVSVQDQLVELKEKIDSRKTKVNSEIAIIEAEKRINACQENVDKQSIRFEKATTEKKRNNAQIALDQAKVNLELAKEAKRELEDNSLDS